jgi:hypothetical protein
MHLLEAEPGAAANAYTTSEDLDEQTHAPPGVAPSASAGSK